MPFSYQSQGIPFAEWANLFTLCLAPLIAHVFGGSPHVTYLFPKGPRWHERLWQYNPTSILWRYFIIADRRVRARSWTASDMAASNAYFWTAQGWDGSLQMMQKSRTYTLKLPGHHRVRLFSGSSLTTLIITLQGVMAVKTLIDGISTADGYSSTINLSSIFYPLAVFGLLRVFPAMWLTDDYLYFADIDRVRSATRSSPEVIASKEDPSLVEVGAQTTMSLLDSGEASSSETLSEKFHRTNSWRALIFRTVYLVPVCCLLALCLIYIVPDAEGTNNLTVTTFLMVLFYLTFLVVSVILFGFYFLSGQSTSSIIPCCNSIWYKMYTAVLMALTLVLVILASLETHRSTCGVYTTYPLNWATDAGLCPDGTTVLPEHPAILGDLQVSFGLATMIGINANDTIDSTATDDLKVIVVGFQGRCYGSWIGNYSDGAPVETLNNTFVPSTYW